jgi:hypothetical protein
MNLEHAHPQKKIYTHPDIVNDPDSVFVSEQEEQKQFKEHLQNQVEKESLVENKIHFTQKLSDEEWLDLSETIRHVRNLPPDQPELRREKLNDIKETAAWFEFELGRAEKRIVRRIYDDVPTSLDTLMAICNQELKNLPVSDLLREKIKSICEQFFIRNQKIREMREEFPDDKDLYKQLTTEEPTGPIEILTTPVSFYIRAHTFHDFARIHNLFIFDKLLEIDTKHPYIQRANSSLGIQTSDSFQPELTNALTAEKALGSPFTLERKLVFIHETQHSLHKFFSQEFDEALADTLYEQEITSLHENNPETYPEILRRLYRRRLEQINEQAKDEILAMLAGGINRLSGIEEALTQSKNYSYYRNNKSLYIETPEIRMRTIKKPFSETLDSDENTIDPRLKTVRIIEKNIESIRESVAEEVFVVEYKRVIHDALRSINKLRKYDFDNELIIKILTHHPLRTWPRRVDRLLIEYNKKPAE